MLIRSSSNSGNSISVATPEIPSPEQLRGWVEALSVPRHFYYESGENRRIALWIRDQLISAGYEVTFHGNTRNVLATPKGFRGKATLVGAHYDSVPGCPGADDNASAVAALLAVASSLKGQGDVVFCAFNREEDGLLGSIEFVEETLPTLPWTVSAAHVIEMVGFASEVPNSQRVPEGLPISLPTVGNFLALLANGISADLMGRVIAVARGTLPELPVHGLEVRLGLERILPVLQRSDHAPFWKAGIPAVMWTDTAEFRNPHYHFESDTPETLDYGFLRKVATLIAASLGDVAF